MKGIFELRAKPATQTNKYLSVEFLLLLLLLLFLLSLSFMLLSRSKDKKKRRSSQ